MPDRHPATAAEFYSYPDWLIAEVCCVHIQTARHWKAGIRKPGDTALKLWRLHRDGRILGEAWQGWGVRQGKLCDPEGHELTQAQLRAYAFVWQIAAEYGKQNSRARDTLYRLASCDAPQPKRKAGSVRQPKRSGDGEHPASARPRALTRLHPRRAATS